MSVEYDVDIHIDCDKCYKDLSHWGEKTYCSGCAGIHDAEHFDTVHAQAVELVDDWLYDNRLILSDKQQAFVELMVESLRDGRMPNVSTLKALTA